MMGNGAKSIWWVILIGIIIALIALGGNNIAEREKERVRENNSAQEQYLEPQIILCSDAKNIRVDNGKIVIKAKPGCWSGWIEIPPSSTFWIFPQKGATVDIQFIDDPNTIIRDGPNQEPFWLEDSSGIFRIRGVAKPAKVTITAKSQSNQHSKH